MLCHTNDIRYTMGWRWRRRWISASADELHSILSFGYMWLKPSYICSCYQLKLQTTKRLTSHERDNSFVEQHFFESDLLDTGFVDNRYDVLYMCCLMPIAKIGMLSSPWNKNSYSKINITQRCSETYAHSIVIWYKRHPNTRVFWISLKNAWYNFESNIYHFMLNINSYKAWFCEVNLK